MMTRYALIANTQYLYEWNFKYYNVSRISDKCRVWRDIGHNVPVPEGSDNKNWIIKIGWSSVLAHSYTYGGHFLNS